MKAHPAAEIFPLMSGEEFESLVRDMREHGQREPIIMFDGLILDGRNRYRACEQIGIAPRMEEWDRNGTPEAFVVSMNLHRRHLNESQRAMIAARLANATRHHRPEVGIPTSSITAADAAAMLNVHRDTVFNAKVVQREGTPEEIAAVESGESAVSTIARQIRDGRPKEERKKKRDAPLSQTGRNPERIQKQQINAEIWGRVRDALTHLTSLPLPQDVVAVARANDRTGLVDARLSKAMQWLKEFEDVWSRDRSKDAA